MFGRKQITQSQIVAQQMRRFFQTLKPFVPDSTNPEEVAKYYAREMWSPPDRDILLREKLANNRCGFNFGISIGGRGEDFERFTKRCVLISDTLLLSHYGQSGKFYPIGTQSNRTIKPPILGYKDGIISSGEHLPTSMYGMHCPSLTKLGRWILDAEPLLKAGLVWYLPHYYVAQCEEKEGGWQQERGTREHIMALDYLFKDGRAVDASGSDPIKSQLVRPIARIDLPFIEGVGLRDFSRITVEEFASYSSFRDFLRQQFLELDESLSNVQSDRELSKLALQIKDQVRATRSEMEKARRKRAVAASGAAIGSVCALLVAVYGPAFQAAITAIGAGGGLWGVIHALADSDIRAIREDKWFYVWALMSKNNTARVI